MEKIVKITIEKFKILDKNAQGVAYINKKGKAYKRVLLKPKGNPVEVSHIANFSDDPILGWQVGETHEIVVEDNVVGDKTYWNFRLPKKDDTAKNAITEQLNRIEQKIDRILSQFEKNEIQREIKKYPEQIPPKGNNTFRSTAQVGENGEGGDFGEEEIGSEEVPF